MSFLFPRWDMLYSSMEGMSWELKAPFLNATISKKKRPYEICNHHCSLVRPWYYGLISWRKRGIGALGGYPKNFLWFFWSLFSSVFFPTPKIVQPKQEIYSPRDPWDLKCLVPTRPLEIPKIFCKKTAAFFTPRGFWSDSNEVNVGWFLGWFLALTWQFEKKVPSTRRKRRKSSSGGNGERCLVYPPWN